MIRARNQVVKITNITECVLKTTFGLTCSNLSRTPSGPKSDAAETHIAPRAVAAKQATTVSYQSLMRYLLGKHSVASTAYNRV